MEKTRDLSFDVLKGILILLVVFGHAVQYEFAEECYHNFVFDFIYTFHMPLFVMVSGYFFYSCTKRDFKEMISNKAKRLLLPWLSWTVIMIVLMTIIRLYLNIYNSSYPCKYILLDIYAEFRTYWYLICVFSLTLFYYPLFRYKHKRICIFICLLAFWIFELCFFYKWSGLLGIVRNYQISRMTLVFGIGILYYFYGNKLRIEHKIILFSVCACGIFFDKTIFFGRYVMEYNIYQRIIDGFLCSILAFLILKEMSNSIGIRNSLINRCLVYFGQNSLGIYLVHIILSHPLTKLTLLEAHHTYISASILFGVYLSFSIVFIEIVKRYFNKFSYLLGI